MWTAPAVRQRLTALSASAFASPDAQLLHVDVVHDHLVEPTAVPLRGPVTSGGA